MDLNWYIVKQDVNSKQLGKFSLAENDHKRKYMENLKGVTFLAHPVDGQPFEWRVMQM